MVSHSKNKYFQLEEVKECLVSAHKKKPIIYISKKWITLLIYRKDIETVVVW